MSLSSLSFARSASAICSSFAFIASSFAITAAVLVALVLWVWLTYRSRRKALDALDAAGFGRNG